MRRGLLAWVLGISMVGLPLLWAGVVRAQQAAESGGAAASDSGPADLADAGRPRAPFRIKPDDVKPPGALERVDRVFGKVVDAMASVLFYRIGTREQQYVQFEQNEYYVRPRDSSEPFVKLAADGSETAETLDGREVERLAALGKFRGGGDGGPWRSGLIGERPVDYLTVPINGARYVRRGEVFHRALPMREMLSDDDVLTEADVAQAAAAGKLALDDAQVEAGAEQPYLLTEPVGGAPLVVLWLACGAVFFTIYMRGYNIWGFRHAIEVVRGKYDNPEEPGEVTHFQALASALSATVGLGNIAGVTIAMTMGGPGAFFWMMACGLFGMTSKFVECTLGQKYRRVKPDGTVLGGPMQYLHHGLAELGLGGIGYVLSIVFAVMCILASFGGGNMFQANQSGEQVLTLIQQPDSREVRRIDREIVEAAAAGDYDRMSELKSARDELVRGMEAFAGRFRPIFGVVLALLVGAVIIGGIKRIGAAAEKVVPSMCLMYIAACLFIILRHIAQVPELVAQIVTEAFTPEAFGGGLLGVLVVGVQRAAFSNEAGVGSAAIAHSAARTEEPVREGTVALMGPFIDTVVVCSMTALVILITGAWNNSAWVVDQGLAGAPLTSRAFEEEIEWFPYLLGVAVVLFAYSTMISWSYYGERCWERLFGARSTLLYKWIYLVAVFVGAIANLGAVLDFSDMMILSMAFPNIFGLVLLCPRVRRDLLDYWGRYRAGQFTEYK